MTCEFCGAADTTEITISPREDTIALCATCAEGLSGAPTDAPHWQCLNGAIWSETQAVQVAAFRVLKALDAAWANDVLDGVYLDPEVQAWAEAGIAEVSDVVHKDSNGTVLANGDTVTLIKDLPVKGAGFTAKRGTAVRNISLVPDNAGHIEGRVEGQRIVILTQFVKKN